MMNEKNKKLRKRKFHPTIYMQDIGCLLYLVM